MVVAHVPSGIVFLRRDSFSPFHFRRLENGMYSRMAFYIGEDGGNGFRQLRGGQHRPWSCSTEWRGAIVCLSFVGSPTEVCFTPGSGRAYAAFQQRSSGSGEMKMIRMGRCDGASRVDAARIAMVADGVAQVWADVECAAVPVLLRMRTARQWIWWKVLFGAERLAVVTPPMSAVESGQTGTRWRSFIAYVRFWQSFPKTSLIHQLKEGRGTWNTFQFA